MKLSSLFSSLICTAVVVHGLNTEDSKLFESLRQVPPGWQSIGAPEPTTRMAFKIALKLQDQSGFEQALFHISDPTHSRYGKHLNREELNEIVRPSAAATKEVSNWLAVSGVKPEDVRFDAEWVNFVATIEQAEAMLKTKFNIYQNQIKKSVINIRTLEYSLPKELFQYIDLVQPTTRFAQFRPEVNQILNKELLGSHSLADAPDVPVTVDCNLTITPACLQNLYNIKGFTPDPQKAGFIGVSGFLEQYAQYGDLQEWIPAYAPWAAGANFTWTSINGGKLLQGANNPNDSSEANLDIQYTLGLTYPMKNHFYSTPSRGPLIPDLDQPTQADNQNEPWLEYITHLLSLPASQLPHTLSSSYGENEQSLPRSYATKVCDMMGQLGSRGVTLLFSSGDTGVGSACQTNDGKNTTRFLPMFPASCPYVTSVGATRFIAPESALFFSSGGFSDIFPRPPWQSIAVPSYLAQLGNRWKGLYNPSGRGFPDVAAQGRKFHIIDKSQDALISGTSASAPAFAAIVALLNAARLQSGSSPLGMINPWLYTVGWAGLTDITEGGSEGCTGVDMYSGLPTPVVPYASWNATKGWDPVTGLGTPLFDKLLRLAVPGKRFFKA